MNILSKLLLGALGMNVKPTAGDIASPVDGDIWYNSTTNKFRKKENSIISDLASSNGLPLVLRSVTTDQTITSEYGLVVPKRYTIATSTRTTIELNGYLNII